ncbi:MAG: hypothetical protein HRU18_11065 [Pseudoalteromonas sp.]|uniref:phage head spike fiber domain-containing protein n=1 Tax=Pseudoalteromonas sp. TaxID=53249 RepID=UPI001D566EEB|nr:LamG-like jellyroll fold domain-containing protein [Pseudoalteromonas sp.]NRA78739.1 hypothetical protein [Pseudoalteromonas sp.]
MGVNKTSIGTYGQARKVGSFLGVVDYDDTTSLGALEFPLSRNSKATEFSDGLIKEVDENVPRFEDGALLLEPQSTNLIAYSEDLDATASSSWWNNQDSTSVLNYDSSPDGQIKSTLLYPTTSGANRSLNENFGTILSGGTYTFSVFAKSAGKNWLRFLHLNASAGNATTHFDLDNGTVGTTNIYTDVGMENYGNGWYRCYATVVASGSTDIVYLMLTDTDNSNISTTNGTDGIEIWGAQIEQLSYATSYIPTNGSAVTRLADVVSGASNENIFNSEEGVLFAEVSAFADNTFKRISLNNGSFLNSVFFDFDNTNNLLGKLIVNGNEVVRISASGLNIEDNNKIALSYKVNDFKLFVNGSKVGTDFVGATPIELNTLSLDLGGGQIFYGKVRDLQVFNRALTDTELQQLTS